MIEAGGRQKAVGRRGSAIARPLAFVFSAYCLLPTAYSLALTQDDVFKSIKENVSESEGSGRMFLAVLLGAAAVIMLLALLSSRRQREASPKALNHSGKLLKEISKRIGLRPAELRQLKLLADAERVAGQPVDSPLVFLLCPSALTVAMRSSRVKVDRKVMAGIARKLGLIATAKGK